MRLTWEGVIASVGLFLWFFPWLFGGIDLLMFFFTNTTFTGIPWVVDTHWRIWVAIMYPIFVLFVLAGLS